MTRGILEGLSGADIRVLCRDASMAPMRRLMARLSPDEIRTAKANGTLKMEVEAEDVRAAVRGTHKSVSGAEIAAYEKWNREFACV